MSFEIVIRREAQIDLDEIFVWYEEQKPELGFDFLEEFEATIHKNPKSILCFLNS